MKDKKFNTSVKCKKLLISFSNDFVCPKCGCIKYYKGFEFEKICRKCKSKISITKNTIFHNLRFGIVKAFEIANEYYNSDYSLSSVGVAKKYCITQKTAWSYLNKIKENKEFVEKIFYQPIKEKKEQKMDNKIKEDNILKLQNFLEKLDEENSNNLMS